MKSHSIDILDSNLHYLEEGSGDPVLFLHGVPTSSHVWRKVIPCLQSTGRCIAPDLIGFGKSGKPDIEYTIFDHINYINEFISKLDLKNLTLVMHGWGSVIGLHYAMQHEGNCKGLVFYEPFLRSMEINEDALPFREQVKVLQDHEGSHDLIMNSSFFVDKTLPQNMMNELSEEDLEVYRQPFQEKGSGKPIIQYLKEIPIHAEENDVNNLIADYTEKLKKSALPKLFLYSIPGFITTVATVMWAKQNLNNLQIVDVGEELHYAQESYPELIGASISAWLQSIEQLQE